MPEYIEIPESFTAPRHLSKSRYVVERTPVMTNFVREFWNGSKWERSYFHDGISVPSCVAAQVAAALGKSPAPLPLVRYPNDEPAYTHDAKDCSTPRGCQGCR